MTFHNNAQEQEPCFSNHFANDPFLVLDISHSVEEQSLRRIKYELKDRDDVVDEINTDIYYMVKEVNKRNFNK